MTTVGGRSTICAKQMKVVRLVVVAPPVICIMELDTDLFFYLYLISMLFFARLPFRFTSRPISKLKSGKSMGCFEKPGDLTTSSPLDPTLARLQPPPPHFINLPIPSAVYVRLNFHPRSTMRMTLLVFQLNVACATNVIGTLNCATE